MMTTTKPTEPSIDDGLRQPPQQHQRQRNHSPPPRQEQQIYAPYTPYRPEDESDFTVQHSRPPPHKNNRPPQVSLAVVGVRRMSSVPELGQTQRGPGGRPMRSHSRQRSNSNKNGWDVNSRIPYEAGQGGNRLIRQKSMERGIVGIRNRPSPSGKRMISGGGGSRPGSRTGSRPGSRNDTHQHPLMPQSRPHPPPGLKMPLAFNNIARERGFTTGSHTVSQPLPHVRSQQRISPSGLPTSPESSTPNLFENRQHSNNQYHYHEPSFLPQLPFSAANSVNNSPHSSFGPPPSNADELRTSFRSALSASDLNRSSGFTTTSETPTESSNAMTVDEAIGMYGSDTDEDEIYTSGMESEYRRSKGDSVLGGSSFSDGGLAYRAKGDSMLGGDISPGERSHHSEQEDRLQEELDKHERKAMHDRGEMHERDDVLDVQQPVEAKPIINHPAVAPSEVPSETGEIDEEIILNSIPVSPVVEHSLEDQAPLEESVTNADPPPLEPRDRYGFKKQTQYVSLAGYMEWETRYTETLERRRKKWDQLLKESGLTPGEGGPVRFPPKSAKIKRYVRKGIPPEWRGAAWFWYAGGQKYLVKYPGKYDELVNHTPLPPDAELIERDLHRTFPDNIKFKPDPPPGTTRLSKLQEKQYETTIVQQLRRVLVAFATHVPRIGYCQSLNFLAGLLLLFMPEEKAFWMLYILTQTHLPGTHELNLEGSSVDQWVLMTSVRDSLPGIWAKIGGGLDGSEVELNSTKLPPVTLCTSSWFMSGFIGSLPIETTLRVWDCLFYEGSKTLFRIALTVFKTGESQIRGVHDPMEIFQVVQTIPRRLVDAGALIEACYRRRNGFGHLSQETIDEKRQERRNAFAEERALIASGVRLSKDDGALRGNFDGASSRGQTSSGHHDLGRKFRKILVKT